MGTFIRILTVCLFMHPTCVLSKELINDAQIREAIVGNTISGREDGAAYVEFINPDGRIVGEDRDGRYTGRWRLNEGRICFSYDKDGGKASDWDCAQVGLEGSRIVWISDGDRSYADLIQGNPNRF